MASVLDVEQLYRAHGYHVLRRARRLLRSETEAQDVLQELFLSLVNDPGQFRQESSAVTWFYGAATHLCLNRIRNRKTRLRLLHERSPVSETQRSRTENILIAEELLAALPDEEAQAVIHYYIDECTHDEIARLLACSRRHVGNLIERSQERLAFTLRRVARRSSNGRGQPGASAESCVGTARPRL